jgi:nucleoside-triphosphatase THEP1
MVIILSGDIGSGKTTFLKGFFGRGPKSGLRLPERDGFLSLRVMEKGRVTGYDLFDLKNSTLHPLLRRSKAAAERMVGDYRVLPEGMAAGETILRRARPSGLLVVDEVGPLELDGRGFWPALSEILRDRTRRVLIVVRVSLVGRFSPLFAAHDVRVVPIDLPSRETMILEAVGR